ncbi:MAG: sorbosone dehydrogenase family protein [Alphaproteobacteria bacterium]|nr:sorbosone dehydrogenase family protein [Alphaproteobacteria bacterium]
MTGRLRRLAAAAAFGALLGGAGCGGAVEPDDLKAIRLPPGFRISLYAEVQGARSMALAPPLGALFVGSRGDEVHVVFDRDNDGAADAVRPVSRSLKVPNGIAWRDGWLYIAEQHRIIRYRPALAKLGPHSPEVIHDRLPDMSHHGWRYAAFGPDGRLYVTVGAPCNICDIGGLQGTILRLDADGGNPEVFASGLRNSVGIDFHPQTGEAFFTDNGGDWLGDDLPPDELNHATRPGLHYGFPHYAGGRAVSPDWKDRAPPPGAQFPVIEFDAHVAALGIHFYRGAMFPAEYRNDAFVAEHGSWNRTSPVGYRIMRVRFDGQGKAVGKEVFAEGWLKDGSSWGRPVDIKELLDGSLLVSDDSGGAIYRITYER